MSSVTMQKWMSSMRRAYQNGKLTQTEIDQLENTPGWTWKDYSSFDHGIEKLQEYTQIKGTPEVHAAFICADGFKLGQWVKQQRRLHKIGSLDAYQISKLESVPAWLWVREAVKPKFEDMLAQLRKELPNRAFKPSPSPQAKLNLHTDSIPPTQKYDVKGNQ